MNVVSKIQEAMNPLLTSDHWATTEHFNAFYYASLFLTNMWTYIIVFILFILGFWAYIYEQRKGAGYQ
jgi:hypothetical protein